MLHYATLRYAMLCYAMPCYATLCNLNSALLSSAQLCSTQLSSAQLSSAQLSSAQFSSAQLSRCRARAMQDVTKLKRRGTGRRRHAPTPHVTTCTPTGKVPDIGIPDGIRSARGGGDLISHHVLPDEKNYRYRNSRWFTERGRGKRFDKSSRVRRRENFPISEFHAVH